MRTTNMYAAGFAGLLAVGLGQTAAAQTGAGSEDKSRISLEEIVVTARRREENLQQVPVAVTAVTGEQLLARSVTDVSMVARQTPSLSIQPRAADPNQMTFALRGQVQNDTLMTLDPSVGVYLNDIYLARSAGANLDLFDVDRVEVLAGPQGTLYGRNTTGGAVKVVTVAAQPGGDVSGYVAAQGGNFSMQRYEGAVNLPLGDKFAVRLAGLATQRDGYSTIRVGNHAGAGGLVGSTPFVTTKTIEADDKDTTALRVSVAFEPTEALSFSLVGDWSELDTHGTIGYDAGATAMSSPPIFTPIPPATTPPKPFGSYTKCSDDFYTACLDWEPDADVKAWGIGFTAAYNLGSGTAKLIYGHRDVDNFFASDIEGSSIPLNNSNLPTTQKQNTVELQYSGDALSDRLHYVTGLYWFKEDGQEDSTSIGLGTGFRTRFLGAFVENESRSVYTQGTYDLTDSLHLTVGARYTEDDKAMDASAFFMAATPGQPTNNVPAGGLCIYNPTLAPNRDVCVFSADDSFSHVSWTAGVDWQIQDDIMVYLKSSNGYRSGGQNLRGLNAQSQRPFEEEEVTDVEVGFKSQLFEALRLNLAYFHSFYKDVQVSQLLNTPAGLTTAVVNQGDADVDGVELQALLNVGRYLSFDATASWTDFQYDTDLFVAQLIPETKYSLGATVELPASYGAWTFHAGYSWQDEFVAGTYFQVVVDNDPQATSGSRGLLDARIALDIERFDLTIAAFGTNLTDEEYYGQALVQATVNNQDEPTQFLGATFNRRQVGEPRMYGVELRKRF